VGSLQPLPGLGQNILLLLLLLLSFILLLFATVRSAVDCAGKYLQRGGGTSYFPFGPVLVEFDMALSTDDPGTLPSEPLAILSVQAAPGSSVQQLAGLTVGPQDFAASAAVTTFTLALNNTWNPRKGIVSFPVLVLPTNSSFNLTSVAVRVCGGTPARTPCNSQWRTTNVPTPTPSIRFAYTGSIVKWLVPASGLYSITARVILY
jgi:hypothetical protein